MKKVAVLTSFLPSLSPYFLNASASQLYKYCGENSGNIAFVYAITQHIANPVILLPWDFDPQQIQEVADIIVLPCANQLGSHLNLAWMSERIEKAQLPVVAIGLGAQSSSQQQDTQISEGTLRWVKAISDLALTKSPNIAVRGKYTGQQLERYNINSFESLGCPSLFINPSPHLGIQIQESWSILPKRVCVAGGHHTWAKTRIIEQQLVSLIHDPYYPGSYICQSTLDNIKLSRCDFNNIDESIFKTINQYLCPHLSKEEFMTWCKNYVYSFYDVQTWIDFLSRYDLTIGPRYHGAALAIQGGKMGVTITVDSRTEELCQTTGVPYIKAEDLSKNITRENLHRLVKFSAEKFDASRINLAKKYVNFLNNNDIYCSELLTGIIS